ncbi:mitochondrial fission ELM1 family protein [Asticcacaulis sp. YBE204]|uniref:mitochondrial fission ELM1 family protein n=1 Tax=Asticcacaulis sp. YBE204 TaxID=1282363 RepID=UPI0003C41108|nr:mitochondrial fission ELM1 family protein [Asticcacaulis sp. YBE204]ESQ79706.1 nucleoside-diphosphate sugar epimerase [Asticcacaulis sp. YBE204]
MLTPPATTDDSLKIPRHDQLVVWAVSDGRAGIHNQVLGLAEAIADLTPAHVVVRHIRYRRMFDRWPTALRLLPHLMLKRDSDPVGRPWPDIWIAAGRATLPHSKRVKKLSGGHTLVVQLQDPREPSKRFDMVVAPLHDQVKGDNVLSIQGSTHRVTPERLKRESTPWAERLSAFDGPFLTVLIGGKSKSHTISAERAEALVQQIRVAVKSKKATLLLSVSRRTPDDARRVLMDGLKDLPGILYDGKGENPYFAFLNAADFLMVTEDSVNMAAEAAATGKPVNILPMDARGSTAKFGRFHQGLQDYGAARPWSGELRQWKYAPLNETRRAAEAVLALYAEKHPDRLAKG